MHQMPGEKKTHRGNLLTTHSTPSPRRADTEQLLRLGRVHLRAVPVMPASTWASHVAQMVKKLPTKAGNISNPGSIPGSGRSPQEGNGNPLQYSCLENPMDRGACRLQSMGSHRVGHDWSDLARTHTPCEWDPRSLPLGQRPSYSHWWQSYQGITMCDRCRNKGKGEESWEFGQEMRWLHPSCLIPPASPRLREDLPPGPGCFCLWHSCMPHSYVYGSTLGKQLISDQKNTF